VGRGGGGEGGGNSGQAEQRTFRYEPGVVASGARGRGPGGEAHDGIRLQVHRAGLALGEGGGGCDGSLEPAVGGHQPGAHLALGVSPARGPDHHGRGDGWVIGAPRHPFGLLRLGRRVIDDLLLFALLGQELLLLLAAEFLLAGPRDTGARLLGRLLGFALRGPTHQLLEGRGALALLFQALGAQAAAHALGQRWPLSRGLVRSSCRARRPALGPTRSFPLCLER
jgi:hypothetical protein